MQDHYFAPRSLITIRRRRDEGIPLLEAKFERNLRGRISHKNAQQILEICAQQNSFENATVNEMMALLQV